MPESEVAACLGLISDTHYPERLDQLPDAVLAISGQRIVLTTKQRTLLRSLATGARN